MPLYRHTCGFNLPGSYPRVVQPLQTEVAKRNVGTSPRQTADTALLNFSIFGALRGQHNVDSLRDASRFSLQHFALEDPNLDSNGTVCGSSFGKSEVHIRPKCVKWHASFTISLDTPHFSASKT